MGISKLEEEKNYSETESGSSNYSDSDFDAEILETQFSNLSINKKIKSKLEEDEELKNILESGNLEKLKVEQCKVYLRKNGLRLTGNKATLIQRIKEHREILNIGGDKMYPVASFVLNCKGDACMGDVVMFEQNVYEMFNLASRSATRPPCGKRMVAGRIVNESYGAAKQQHTFTVTHSRNQIEVLWSKGEKPLPPLHPLLIKGRNLYRLKTMRQKWEDEDARSKILMEKHSRGTLARDARETRVQEKERRKMLKEKRASKEKKSERQFQSNSSLPVKQDIQAGKPDSSVSKVALEAQNLSINTALSKFTVGGQNSWMTTGAMNQACRQPLTTTNTCHSANQAYRQPLTSTNSYHSNNQADRQPLTSTNSYHSNNNQAHRQPLTSTNSYHSNNQAHRQPFRNTNSYHSNNRAYSQPLTSANSYHSNNLLNRQCNRPQKPCKFYAQGRCNFGDNCRFSHTLTENYGQRREERPYYQSRFERQQY